MKRHICLLSVLSCGLLVSTAQEEPQFDVKTLRMEVLYDVESPREFMEGKGMGVSALVTAPKGTTIVKSDGAKKGEARITAKDSKGTEIKGWETNPFFYRISKEGNHALVTMGTDELPSKGAQWVELDGTVTLDVSVGKKTTEAKEVELKKGGTFELDGISVKVDDVKDVTPSSWDKSVQSVTFSVKGDADKGGDVEDLVFTDSEGNALKADKTMSSRMATGKTVEYNWTYNFEKKADKVKIAVVKWDGKKQVNVPVKLRMSLYAAKSL